MFEFLDEIDPKLVFPVTCGKSEHRHWILYIWIFHGANFQLKLTYAQKAYFYLKTEKVNITEIFCRFELF